MDSALFSPLRLQTWLSAKERKILQKKKKILLNPENYLEEKKCSNLFRVTITEKKMAAGFFYYLSKVIALFPPLLYDADCSFISFILQGVVG